VVDCLDAEDELNCKPLLPPSLLTHGIKHLLSGKELEEEILTKGKISLQVERGGQVNDIWSSGTNEETVDNKINEMESKILDIAENSSSLWKHFEIRESKLNLPNKIEHTSRLLLHKKDTKDLLSDKQGSESGFLDVGILEHTHVSDHNRKEEFSANSFENGQLVQTVADVLLPHNTQKLSTSYIERKAENTFDDPVQTDEVSDIFIQNDAKRAALTQSYSMSWAEKRGNSMSSHETQGNTVSRGETQGSTIPYDEVKVISVFPSETLTNTMSHSEIQVNKMSLGAIQDSTISHAETQDNIVSYGETQRNTTDFSEAQGNSVSYNETQSSTIYSETLSNTVSESETKSNTVYSEALSNSISYSETEDNISSENTTEWNTLSDITTQNSILPDKVTKRETNLGKIRRRESRFLVAQMNSIHNARGMESIFNIMTPKDEITESKSSSTANAQPTIKKNYSLFSNMSPVTNKQDALEVEFSPADSNVVVYSTVTENFTAPSPLSINYVNDLSPAKSLVLTGWNDQPLNYIKHKNEAEGETGISEPKSNTEVAGIFTANIASSIPLHGSNDSESTLFTEWSESLLARGSSHSSSESAHSHPSYGATVTSSLTFNCKM
jgi:hypothetical protein